MAFLRRLIGRSRAAEAEPHVAEPSCAHTMLTARWENAQDMGNEAKASSFTCSACGATFSPEEAARVRTSGAPRLD